MKLVRTLITKMWCSVLIINARAWR